MLISYILKSSQYILQRKLISYFLFYPLLTMSNPRENLQIYSYNILSSINVNKSCLSKQNLSFMYLNLKEERIDSFDRTITSQEIIINGIDNVIMKSKLMSFLAISLNNKTIFDLTNVQHWVTQMKLSGFFFSVNYAVQFIEQHQIININVKVNPILKMICISNYKNKLIPFSEILIAFHQQLGYPLNFIQVNEATQVITKWYHRRGYDLANVRFVRLNGVDKSILINIVEGTIKRAEIHVECFRNTFVSDQFIFPMPILLKILNIKINSIFNSYDLENGLKELHQKNIIKSGNYRVIGEENLSIIISLEPQTDKVTYLFSKKIELAYKSIELLRSLLSSSFTQILKKSLFIHSIQEFSKDSRLLLVGHDTLFYPIMYKYNLKIIKAVSSTLVCHWLKIYKFFFNNLAPISFDDFGLKYSINNIGFKKNFFTLNFRPSKFKSYYCLTYSTYTINLLKNIKNYIIYEIFQENNLNTFIDYTFPQYKTALLKDCSRSHLLSQSSVSVKSKQKFNRYTYLKRKLSIRNISYKYLHLYNFSNWYALHLDLKAQDFSLLLPMVQHLWNQNIEYFTNLEWQLKSNSQIPQASSTKFFIRSVHTMPLNFSDISNIIVSKYNYTNKIIVELEQNINIYKQRFHLLGLAIKLFGDEIYIPAFEQNLLMEPSLIRGYSEQVCLLPNQFGKLSLEYLIPITTKNSILLFFDYAYGLTYQKLNKNGSSCITHVSLNEVIANKNQISYGIGFHFKAPIRQIPPLRFEYGYNIDATSCFHIRIKKNKL